MTLFLAKFMDTFSNIFIYFDKEEKTSLSRRRYELSTQKQYS